MPHVITPAFPAYVSGHASVSGAAAQVLSTFFPQKQNHFLSLAQEAADSRLYGGIHFRSDNEEGLKLGLKVGKQACSEKLHMSSTTPTRT